MKVLGIESSCDDTSASVVEDGSKLLSLVSATSANIHVKYGGVVPEIAARSHIEVIMPVINQALEGAKCSWDDIDTIAVTYGAGLGGSLLIGVMTARTLAIAHNKPLFAINHVEAHIYANFITKSSLSDYKMPTSPPQFPLLAIIVSGGHSQLVLLREHFDYIVLGKTQDDAIGEAFDKVAKILGLPYPGGPSLSNLAEKGHPQAYKLPIAQMPGYDFSYSGPKTAVLRLAQSLIGESYDFPSFKLADRLSEPQKADIAASFQYTAVKTITKKAKAAFEEYNPKSVVLAGGVAANDELRRQLTEAIPLPLSFPDIKLCTDNGAMVATLGYYKALLNQPGADPYSLEIQPNLKM